MGREEGFKIQTPTRARDREVGVTTDARLETTKVGRANNVGAPARKKETVFTSFSRSKKRNASRKWVGKHNGGK